MKIPADEVHVWVQDLDDATVPHGDFLDETERARSRAFSREVHRRRWSAGRSGLRRVLARYLGGVDPRNVALAHEPGRSPVLAGGGDLSFNRSAAGSKAVVAVTRMGRVGIDLEEMASDNDPPDLADWLFTRRKADCVEEANGDDHSRRFLQTWTAKEAVVKVGGFGVELLPSVEVRAANPMLVLSPPAGTSAEDWHLRRVDAGPGTVCTLAVFGVPAPPTVLLSVCRSPHLCPCPPWPEGTSVAPCPTFPGPPPLHCGCRRWE